MSTLLERFDALCEQVRATADAATRDQQISSFVWDEDARRQQAEEEFLRERLAHCDEAVDVDLHDLPHDFVPESEEAYAERMRPHATVQEAVEAYVLSGFMRLDEALLEAFGFPPERARQLHAADKVREWMNHYSFPEMLTIENAERLLSDFRDDRQRANEEMLRGEAAE